MSKDDMLYTRGCTLAKNDAGESCCLQKGSCHKLSVHDWTDGLHNATLPADIVEVRFKNTRKGYYRTTPDLAIATGDMVAVEASPGHDIGMVSLTGDLVSYQLYRQSMPYDTTEFKKVYRKAKPSDLEKWAEAIGQEHSLMIRSRQMVCDLRLNMKIGDVEMHGDKTKAIFYYIAEERVDFRELIKIMAEEFRIRIEMRQIGARQEAGRIGGIGPCGRELCCTQWLQSFASVSTNAAREQDIAINQQKLAGQCGKLKCCLNYELETYIDAQKDFPKTHIPLETRDGQAHHHKTDIFKRLMWYNFDKYSMENLVAVPVDRVNEIIAQNKKGTKVDSLLTEQYLAQVPVDKEPDFSSSAGEDSITRFDKKARPSNNKNRRNKKGREQGSPQPDTSGGQAPSAAAAPSAQPANRGRSNDTPQANAALPNRPQQPKANVAPMANTTPVAESTAPADKSRNRGNYRGNRRGGHNNNKAPQQGNGNQPRQDKNRDTNG